MSESAEKRSEDLEKVEIGGAIPAPPIAPAPANDVDRDAAPGPQAKIPANDDAAVEPAATPAAAEPAPTPAEEKRNKKPVSPLDDPMLEDMVRRGDEDRWLASRFAPPAARKRLMALYAFNLEVASIADKVSEPRLGEIRLQWWRDAVEGIFRDGRAPDHPAALALAAAIAEAGLPIEPFGALLTARALDLNPAPFETWADLDSYIDDSDGALMRLAAAICAPDAPVSPRRTQGLQTAARAWGYLSLLQALPAWAARGRTFYPANLRGNLGIANRVAPTDKDEASFAFAAHTVLDRAIGAQKNVSRFAETFSKEMYPAVGYVALAPLYIRAQAQRELGRTVRTPSLFKRQWKLVWSAARGAL